MSLIELGKSKEQSHAEEEIRSLGKLVWWIGAICAIAGKAWKKFETVSYNEASGLARGVYNVTNQMRADHAAARKLYSLLILVGVILTLVGCVFLLIAYILKRKRIAEKKADK
jgi:beta-lactamase regulating signal transducer with metallopeptidase domain